MAGDKHPDKHLDCPRCDSRLTSRNRLTGDITCDSCGYLVAPTTD